MARIHGLVSEYTNENGTTIGIHKVTEDTVGSYDIIGLGNQDVRIGDLLVVDPNNGTKFDRITEGELRDNGWSAVDSDLSSVDTRSAETRRADGNLTEMSDEPHRYPSEEDTTVYAEPDDDHIDDYDPSDYKVREIQGYMDRNPEFAQAVRDKEAEGKNRTSVVNYGL